jgi:hypothetical protein
MSARTLGGMLVESTFSAEPIGISVLSQDHLLANLVENDLGILEHYRIARQAS